MDATPARSPFDVYELIEEMRRRGPGMFLGKPSLLLMQTYINGCFHMASRHGVDRAEQPDFHGLHDWVSKRIRGRPAGALGWCTIILEECGGNDAEALDRFFDLVDEYRQCGGALPKRGKGTNA